MVIFFGYDLITKKLHAIVTKNLGVIMQEFGATGENIVVFLVILGIVGIILTRKK
jgi:hypothetical protein